MERTVTLFALISTAVGGAALVGAGALALDTVEFLGSSKTAVAQVVSLEEAHSSRGDLLYRPVFRFATAEGREVTFRSSSSSSPPAYDVGERLEVCYRESAPEHAREKSITSLWMGPLLLGGLGSVFAALGSGTVFVRRRRAAQRARLLREGRRIETDFQNVEVNMQVTVNGSNPWRVVTQWKNPESGQLHLFRSENVWFDPSAHISRRLITVYLDPKDFKKYHVDISFLPVVFG